MPKDPKRHLILSDRECDRVLEGIPKTVLLHDAIIPFDYGEVIYISRSSFRDPDTAIPIATATVQEFYERQIADLTVQAVLLVDIQPMP